MKTTTTQTAPADTWTESDNAAAIREGWILSQVDNRPDLVEIQRLDEDTRERFKSDAEAFAHVKAWSTQTPLHRKAMALLRGVCPSCGTRAESFELGGIPYSTLLHRVGVCAACVNA